MISHATSSSSRVTFVGHGDDAAVARFDFLKVGERLFEDVVERNDHHHRHLVVDERDGAVLHLASRIAFGVDVGNFLELERALERDRVVDAAAEIEEVARLAVLARDFFDLALAAR
jgi:hypothetical protein